MDMSIGGLSWAGWHFGKWGRAKDWRLHAPDGQNFLALDLLELHGLRLDLDYLRMRCRELEGKVAATACYFSCEEIESLYRAVSAIERAIARPKHKRPWIEIAKGGEVRSYTAKNSGAGSHRHT